MGLSAGITKPYVETGCVTLRKTLRSTSACAKLRVWMPCAVTSAYELANTCAVLNRSAGVRVDRSRHRLWWYVMWNLPVSSAASAGSPPTSDV